MRDLLSPVVCVVQQMKHSSLCLVACGIDIHVFLVGLLLSGSGLNPASSQKTLYFLAFQLFSSSGQQFYNLCTSHDIVCATKDSSPERHIEVAGHCQVCMRHHPSCWLQHIGREALIIPFLKRTSITICFLTYYASSIVATFSAAA